MTFSLNLLLIVNISPVNEKDGMCVINIIKAFEISFVYVQNYVLNLIDYYTVDYSLLGGVGSEPAQPCFKYF